MSNSSMKKQRSENKGIKEHFRKFLVSLKRRPHNIALVMLVFAFLYYSFNLTTISNTTAKIQGNSMGLCGFVIMLFSILSFVCFLNAFPKRQKPNYPVIVVMYLMFAAVISCDIIYRNRIWTAVTRPENPIQITEQTQYILKAYNMLQVHIVLVIIVAALVALLPVYGRLLKKINTSISVEDNGKLDTIDISEE